MWGGAGRIEDAMSNVAARCAAFRGRSREGRVER